MKIPKNKYLKSLSPTYKKKPIEITNVVLKTFLKIKCHMNIYKKDHVQNGSMKYTSIYENQSTKKGLGILARQIGLRTSTYINMIYRFIRIHGTYRFTNINRKNGFTRLGKNG